MTTPCDGFVEAGGFSPEFTCEDIEFTFRVHNVGLLMNEQAGHSYPLRELIRLMLVGVADLFLYRPLLVAAHAKGMVDYVRGRTSWDKFPRNGRVS